MFIHERENWTDFRWDTSQLAVCLESVSRKQGQLFGRLSALGFDGQLSTMAENLTWDLVQSSEIEGIRLNADEVRSSIARRLGIQNVRYTAPSHYVDSVVAVLMDAVEHYDRPISKDTAIRDIQDLVTKEVLRVDVPGAKRPSFSIIYDENDLTQVFSDVRVNDGWLTAVYMGKPVREHLLPLDASRYEKGELSIQSLLDKYCSYLTL